MAQQRPSPAAALYPHLPHQSNDVARLAQQHDRKTTAEAIYPSPQAAYEEYREQYQTHVGLLNARLRERR